MKKSELIECVERIAKDTSLKNILSDKEAGKLTLGKSQFRAMAELCEKADYFEEIKLMLEYKTAKGNGWDITIKDGKKCGDVFINQIEEIRAKSCADGSAVLRNLSLFFGYMYWKAAVLIEEKKSENSVADRNYTKGGIR